MSVKSRMLVELDNGSAVCVDVPEYLLDLMHKAKDDKTRRELEEAYEDFENEVRSNPKYKNIKGMNLRKLRKIKKL